jgi:hypothetical protein
MKNILKLEEFAMTSLTIYYLTTLHIGISQWWYILLFFSPDLSMVFYMFGKKVGAIGYNIFHHKLLALAVFLAGLITHNPYLLFSGAILFGHSSFDRMMGYGLKYFEGFKHTHLGTL